MTTTAQHFSTAWRKLIRHCARLNFGHLENLVFVNGEPQDGFRSIKTFSPGKDNGPSKLIDAPDIARKPQWVEVLSLAASMPNLQVAKFEIAHGLPLKLQLETEMEADHA
jgi:hypothetical protein